MYILVVNRSTTSKKYFGSTADFAANQISAISPCENSKEPLKLWTVEVLFMLFAVFHKDRIQR